MLDVIDEKYAASARKWTSQELNGAWIAKKSLAFYVSEIFRFKEKKQRNANSFVYEQSGFDHFYEILDGTCLLIPFLQTSLVRFRFLKSYFECLKSINDVGNWDDGRLKDCFLLSFCMLTWDWLEVRVLSTGHQFSQQKQWILSKLAWKEFCTTSLSLIPQSSHNDPTIYNSA